MKILFLTDNFPPEYNAPATRTFEHCKQWASQGSSVTVITCAPNFPQGRVYPGYRNHLKKTEIIDGIKVFRVWSYITANVGFLRRSFDFLSFAISSFFCGLTIKCDIIVATSPQFFTAVSGCALGIIRRKRWVMEVRDLWPESIKAVGAVRTNWVISMLEKLELFLYRRAHKIVTVTDSFKANLIERGIPSEKIFVIKNGVDLSKYAPREKNRDLLKRFNINGKFVIGYVGTHGLAHSLDFIVESINALKDETFHFVFVGDGAEKKNIVKTAKILNLQNVTFVDPVRKDEIQSYLSMMDVALVPLKKSTTFESVIPSKVFESVAMNIPILLGVNGESRSIIESYNAGLYFEPENQKDFLEKLLLIKQRINSDPTFFSDGCRQMAHDFDRTTLARNMLQVLSME